jgi:hypothetical protein
VNGIFLLKDLVIAEDAQCLAFVRPDAHFTAAFGAGSDDIRDGIDRYQGILIPIIMF